MITKRKKRDRRKGMKFQIQRPAWQVNSNNNYYNVLKIFDDDDGDDDDHDHDESNTKAEKMQKKVTTKELQIKQSY